MLDPVTLVVIGIVLALAFDFGNGMHDASNAISTVVVTGVLSLRQAVVLSAFFNFVAAFGFSTAVAATIGSGLVQPTAVTPLMILSGLVAAIFWVYFTAWIGLPISSSHSLIGGILGSAIAGAGVAVVKTQGVITVLSFILVAPVLGMLGAYLFTALVLHLVSRVHPNQVNQYFRKLQLLSASVYSFGHGTNDAQKTMGVISILLFSGGLMQGPFHVPFWVVILSHATIALGTLAGGVRIIKTMGLKITKLRPIQGFCAETAGAGVILGSSWFGIPVSTTHVISGAITGVGMTRRMSAVRWQIARSIVTAWIFTIPVTAAIGAASYFLLHALAG